MEVYIKYTPRWSSFKVSGIYCTKPDGDDEHIN